MKAGDLVVETAAALNSNRARSFLTVLGIVIGISAVIAMTALIGGMKTALVGEMGLSQAKVVYMMGSYGRETTLADVNDMARDLRGYYDTVMPIGYGSAEVVSSKQNSNGSISGVYAEYADIMGLRIAQGRFFTQRESDSGALVAVLDDAGVRALFESSTAQVVGQTVRISGVDYEIVGVVAADATMGESGYINVYMPFSTCSQRIAGGTAVSQMVGLAKDEVDVEEAAAAAKEWLVKRFQVPESEQESALYVLTMQSVIEELDALMASFQMLMTVVASISLLVGGIGIMNMMLTNVTERIREIGLRKALGARRRDITRQFLMESVCLTLAGGVFGVLLGYAGAFGLAGLAGAALVMAGGMSITPSIDPESVALVAGICIFIGVVFGYYPARRAARLDPVESLHYQ